MDDLYSQPNKNDPAEAHNTASSHATPECPAASLRQEPFSFKSNKQAACIFGHCDENLRLIETHMGVTIYGRGASIMLEGSPSAVEQSVATLKYLEELSKHMTSPGLAETQAALAFFRPYPPSSDTKNIQNNTPPPPTTLASIDTGSKKIYSRSPTQSLYIQALCSCDIVFGVGPAGTGKTYLAVAYAISLLEKGLVDKLIFCRPALEAGERLGFLPGDMKEKVDPYLRPLYDALYAILPKEKAEAYLQSNTIEIAPLAFMRGRSLTHAAIILDEAQNTTSMQMKMFLTRFGEGSRMIVTGDLMQSDLPRGEISGLKEASLLLAQTPGIKIVTFGPQEVVRHPLVKAILAAYDQGACGKNSSIPPCANTTAEALEPLAPKAGSNPIEARS